jgi:MFS family permease
MLRPQMGMWGRFSESWHAFAGAFRSRELRRLQLAGVGSTLAVWIYSIAIAVYAYRENGAKAVGIVLFVRWSLAAVFAPWLALFADRASRRRVMLAVDLARTALVAVMTVVAATGGPPLVVYACAVLVSIVSSAFAPAQAALLPTLSKTPEELTASNLALETISGVGMFVGPALGGLVLAFRGPWLVFLLGGVGYLWSGLCVAGLTPDEAPAAEEKKPIVGELVAGFTAIASDRRLQIVIGLIGVQMFAVGALEVVLVVDSIRVLHAGNSGVGWLNTALGVGGLLGGVLGVTLTARKRLAGDFSLGFLVYGAALAVLGLFTNFGVALVLFALVGMGGTLIDVTGMTLLQRAAPAEVVGRVFGVLQSLMLATTAVGALVTPLLISALDPAWAFAAVGLLLPAAVLPALRSLTAIDRSARIAVEPLELLRGIAIFAPLPTPVLEWLASLAAEVHVPAMTAVVTQGDHGDRFYVIAEGTATVEIDGAETSTLSRGDFFGEIALLRDVPRTATVRAVDELRLFALERDDFIAAVTGHAPSRDAADSIVSARLPAAATV